MSLDSSNVKSSSTLSALSPSIGEKKAQIPAPSSWASLFRHNASAISVHGIDAASSTILSPDTPSSPVSPKPTSLLGNYCEFTFDLIS
jgi:hypothetical protein